MSISLDPVCDTRLRVQVLFVNTSSIKSDTGDRKWRILRVGERGLRNQSFSASVSNQPTTNRSRHSIKAQGDWCVGSRQAGCVLSSAAILSHVSSTFSGPQKFPSWSDETYRRRCRKISHAHCGEARHPAGRLRPNRPDLAVPCCPIAAVASPRRRMHA
jgi:hypothetical protein